MAGFNLRNTVDGIVDYKRKWDNAKATGKDTSEFEKGAAAYYQELRDNGRGDVADYLQKSDSITAGEYLKTLTPNYQATAGDLQKKSNDVYDWTKGAGSQIAKDYDMVYQTIGVTPTRTDYGKDILSGYGLAADAAYKSSLGGGAENNGGNVDSYAAAQANRNKAAMVKEGYGTVLDYYNSIAGNATKWAGDKANALGGFAGLMQGNVTDDRDTVEKAFEAELAQEKMANDMIIAGNDNATDVYVQQLKNAGKGTPTGGVQSTVKPADIVDDIINRYTKDSFAVVEETEYGNKYGKDGVVTDLTAVASDLQSIIDDTTIPLEQRQAVYNNARLRGVQVASPSTINDENGVYVQTEPITDRTRLDYIDKYVKKYNTNQEKANFLLTIANNFNLSDGNILWLARKYNIKF